MSIFPRARTGEYIQYFRPAAASARSRSAGSSKEPCLRLELFAANQELDSRVLLHVLNPLVLDVRRPDEHLVALNDEPDFDFAGLPRLSPVVGQDQGRFACEPLQPCQCVRFHKLSFCEPQRYR